MPKATDAITISEDRLSAARAAAISRHIAACNALEAACRESVAHDQALAKRIRAISARLESRPVQGGSL